MLVNEPIQIIRTQINHVYVNNYLPQFSVAKTELVSIHVFDHNAMNLNLR